MKKLLPALVLVFLCHVLAAQPSDAYLSSRMAAGKMPGASMVVIKDGHWVFNRNLGKADIANNKDVTRQTVFMLASVSKTMTATAIMQLWEKGLIVLDADVNNYLPFQLHHPQFPNDSITVRMLLTHTASIEDNWNVMIPLYVNGDSPIPLDSFMRQYYVPGGPYYSAAGNFYTYQPGSQYNYSNMAITLAAYLVERMTGDLFSHYCDTAIFDKLCMKNTSFLLAGLPDTGLVARPYSWVSGSYEDNGLYGYPDYPDGQLRTNITALARFMTMIMQYGVFEGTRILDSSTVAYMLQQQTPVDPAQGIVFYSAASSNGDLLWGHNGGDAGVSTAMYFNLAKKTGAIVLTNGDGTVSSYPDLLVDTLYKYGLTVTPSASDTFPPCNEPTAVAGLPETEHIEISPNPTYGNVHLTMTGPGRMILSDIRGQVKAVYALRQGDNLLYLEGSLPEGMYLARIYDSRERLLATRKLVYLR